VGNWFLFAILVLIGLTIPFAILYLITNTLRIEHAMDDPEAFVKAYRARNMRLSRTAGDS
jgi:hypothetical protein